MSTIAYPIIKASNVDLLLDVVQIELAADVTAAAGTLTVASITGVGVGDYLLMGEFGQEMTEIVRVHTVTTPSGTTITLNANTVYAHPRGTMVYRIDRNQVEFSRATTLAGSKSVLATSDIQCDQLFTEYEDTSNTTGFGFYRFKNSADTTYSNYSESYPYAGYGQQTLKVIFDSALLSLGQIDEFGQPQFPPSLSREAGVIAVNDCQLELKELKHRWSYLTQFNYLVSELTTGQDTYALPSDIAEQEGQLSILAARVGSDYDLKFIDKQKLNVRRVNTVKDSLGAAITSTGDLTVTLTDSSDFGSSGSIYVIDDDATAFDTIDYTANAKSTNVLSGVTNIAETHANGAIVWQGITFGTPRVFTAFEGNIVVDPVPDVARNRMNLYIDAYINPVVVNDLADTVDFPSTVVKPYVSYRFAQILGDSGKAAQFYGVYQAETQKILRKESTGHAPSFKPTRLPDVTSNFGLRRVNNGNSND